MKSSLAAVVIERWVRSSLAHPRLWAGAAIAVMLAGAALTTRIRLADDTRALIAGADPGITQQLDAIAQLSAVDELLIDVDGRAASPGQLERAAAALTDQLRHSPQFKNARYQADPATLLRLTHSLLPLRFVIDPRDPEQLFAPAALKSRLRTLRAMLLAPQGIVQEQFLLQDPLGSLHAALAPLSVAPGLSKLDTSHGRFDSKDGHHILVIATPRGNPFAGHVADRTMAVLARARKAVHAVAPLVALRVIGAHRFAHDAQQIVMRDVHLTFGFTSVIVLAIFVAFFRRLRLALVALPPLAFGACVGGGIAGLIGRPIHGIVLAFSAACLGLSIDYTIHLLAATAHTGGDLHRTLPVAARRIGRSLALAAGSTVAGLGVLAASHVTALAQMAYLAMGAVGGALVGNLVWVPILLPALAGTGVTPSRLQGPWSSGVRIARRWPRAVVLTAMLLATAFVIAARHSRIDGDLRHLDTHTPQARKDEQVFTQAFGDPEASSLALVQAPDLDQALQRAANAASSLRAAGIRRVLSPTALAPPPSLRRARRARWCDPSRHYGAELDRAAQALGFRAGAFDSFTRALAHLCGPAGAQVDPKPALAALGRLLGRPIVHTSPDGTTRLAVAFEAPTAKSAHVRKALAALPGVTLVDRAALTGRLVHLIAADLPRLGGIALLIVALMLVIAFGNLRQPLHALAPCVLGILATVGVMAWLDWPINLMNLCVFPLLAGLGIDYGILMADDPDEPGDTEPSPPAGDILIERAFSVTVAAATTLAGFGTLALARYNAIATIGRSVALAVTACAVFALFLPPALAALGSKGERNKDEQQGQYETGPTHDGRWVP